MGLATANGDSQASGLKFLIYGRIGWIGSLLGRLCADRGIGFAYGAGRLENRPQLEVNIAASTPRLQPRRGHRQPERRLVRDPPRGDSPSLTSAASAASSSSTMPPGASLSTTRSTLSALASGSWRRTRPNSSAPSTPRPRPWSKSC